MWKLKLSFVVAVATAVVVGVEATKGEWALATDVQKYYRCLPYDWYLVTTSGEGFSPERGELVQFRTPDYVERLTSQFEVIKIVAGVEGDSWEIADDRLYINGEFWGEMFLMAATGREPGSLDGRGVVPADHVYVLGTNPSSYDSRYWGPLATGNINGKAHVIF
jgi:conjugal transfer pilin signal peptidase TrbI